MKKEIIVELNKTFEESAYTQNGVAYWMAQDIQELSQNLPALPAGKIRGYWKNAFSQWRGCEPVFGFKSPRSGFFAHFQAFEIVLVNSLISLFLLPFVFILDIMVFVEKVELSKIRNRSYLATETVCTEKCGKFFGIPRAAKLHKQIQ